MTTMKTGDKVRLVKPHTLWGQFFSAREVSVGQTGVVSKINRISGDSEDYACVDWDEHSPAEKSAVDVSCLEVCTDKSGPVTFEELKEVFEDGLSKIGPFDKTDYALSWVLNHFDIRHKG